MTECGIHFNSKAGCVATGRNMLVDVCIVGLLWVVLACIVLSCFGPLYCALSCF